MLPTVVWRGRKWRTNLDSPYPKLVGLCSRPNTTDKTIPHIHQIHTHLGRSLTQVLCPPQKFMNKTFLSWKLIGGLVKHTANFAVVDRLPLRNAKKPGNIHNRWQVIDGSQNYCHTFRTKGEAINHLYFMQWRKDGGHKIVLGVFEPKRKRRHERQLPLTFNCLPSFDILAKGKANDVPIDRTKIAGPGAVSAFA